MKAINRDTLIAIVLLLFCGFLIWAGWQIRDPQFGELSPAAWPKGVTYVLTVFCLIYFFQSVLAGADERPEPAPEHRGLAGFFRKYANPIVCFALYFAFLWTLPFFGTLIGGSLLVFLLLSVLGGIQPKQIVLHALISVISVGAMWALFTYGLRVLLPRGEIIPGI